MTTSLEERLTAALDARASQVDASDLRPAPPPEQAGRSRAWMPWTLAAAASIAVVIAIPYGVTQIADDSSSPPPATNTPSPTPPSDESAGWPVIADGAADLNGDGSGDVVRLRLAPGTDGPLRVEVASRLGTAFTFLPESAPSYRLEAARDIDDDGGEEVLVSAGTTLQVFDLVDGELIRLTAPGDPPLVRRIDAEGRSVTWASHAAGLYSIRSTEPMRRGVEEYVVERWRWGVSGGALVAGPPRVGCVRADAPTKLVECSPPEVPTRFEATELTEVGSDTTIQLDFEVDGNPVSARLEYADGYAGDWIGEGDAQLVVTAGDRTWRIDIPVGPLPSLVRQPVKVDPTGGLGVLVIQHGIGFDAWNVFGWSNGELIALALPSDPPYLWTEDGTGPVTSSVTRTWVQGGWMYTAVETGGGDGQEVYRWDGSGTALRPTRLGVFCFDLDNPGGSC